MMTVEMPDEYKILAAKKELRILIDKYDEQILRWCNIPTSNKALMYDIFKQDLLKIESILL
jgi:hypothetical protein